MDIEVSLAITPPRGPWCDARAPFAHYSPVDYRLRVPDEWAVRRSHRCGTACFAPGAAACAEAQGGVAIYVELEQPRSRVPRRRSPLRPEEKPRKSHVHERLTSAPTSPTPSTKHEPKTQAPNFKLETQPPPRPSTKRARPKADVDGPNTASLPSKKRRLRLELITSRLSRPFSLPATHILNREARAAGDRRFPRVAPHAEARRGAPEVRRFAVLNRARCVRGTTWSEMGGHLLQPPRRAPVGRTSSPHPAPIKIPMGSPLSPPRQPLPLPARQIPKSTPSPPPPQCRSPHEEDDDCEAFPGSLYGECDDPEDVYSDFGAIFDAGARGEEEEGRCFEEYLDELDGISWAAR